ncbi:glycine cleavage system protein GcvH [Candidatus Peregrinibacteria bacterium]|nr:glycine cleavage system protein GcvH [Candidatus Peregrinibacteria bacterium]
MRIPTIKDDRLYTKEHEWVKIEGDAAMVGISDYAQDLLTDVVFVELPKAGKALEQFKPACVVESVKSVSDVYAPLSGTVSEANSALEKSPEAINGDPYGAGWIFKITGFKTEETANLMDAAAYKAFIATLKH